MTTDPTLPIEPSGPVPELAAPPPWTAPVPPPPPAPGPVPPPPAQTTVPVPPPPPPAQTTVPVPPPPAQTTVPVPPPPPPAQTTVPVPPPPPAAPVAPVQQYQQVGQYPSAHTYAPVPAPVPMPATGAPPAPGAPPAGRSRKPLVIAAVVVGALVTVAALGGGGYWAYRTFLAPHATAIASSPVVADLPSKPSTRWEWTPQASSDEVDYVSRGDLAPVGTDAVLVAAQFNYDSWFSDGGYDAGWFEGYDEQYDQGSAAAANYQGAVDAWYASDVYTDYPDVLDYLPAGLTEDELYKDENRGYLDGLSNGLYGDGNRLVAPPKVAFRPTVSLLDAVTGDERWKHDASDGIEADVPAKLTVRAFAPRAGAFVGYWVVAQDAKTGEYASTLVGLSAQTGEEIARTELDGTPASTDVDGDTLVISLDAGDGTREVVALSTADLSKRWSKSLDDDASACVFAPGTVAFAAYATPAVAADGTPRCSVVGVTAFAALADGTKVDTLPVGDGVAYVPLGNDLLRYDGDYGQGEDYDFASYQGEVVRVTMDGTEVWKDPIDFDPQNHPAVVDGIVVREDFTRDSGRIMVLDAASGRDSWEHAVKVDGVVCGFGDALVVRDGSDVVFLDLGSGEKRFAADVDAEDYVQLMGQGKELLYVSTSSGLRAISPAEQDVSWRMRPGDDEYVVPVGGRFYLYGTTGFEALGAD